MGVEETVYNQGEEKAEPLDLSPREGNGNISVSPDQNRNDVAELDDRGSGKTQLCCSSPNLSPQPSPGESSNKKKGSSSGKKKNSQKRF